MKKLTPIILAALVISMLPLLGGSMIWVLGGADGLDINGSTQMTGRPQPFQWAYKENFPLFSYYNSLIEI